jgi:hypothetical protein
MLNGASNHQKQLVLIRFSYYLREIPHFVRNDNLCLLMMGRSGDSQWNGSKILIRKTNRHFFPFLIPNKTLSFRTK